jgi:hypothetical protein
MGLGDLAGKAKDMLGGHEEQVEGAIDKAEDVAKDRLPDQADSVIEGAAGQAKNFLGSDGDAPAQ